MRVMPMTVFTLFDLQGASCILTFLNIFKLDATLNQLGAFKNKPGLRKMLFVYQAFNHQNLFTQKSAGEPREGKVGKFITHPNKFFAATLRLHREPIRFQTAAPHDPEIVRREVERLANFPAAEAVNCAEGKRFGEARRQLRKAAVENL